MISAYPFGAGDHFSCIMEEIMNQSKKCNITIKWIISLLISTQTTLMCGSAGYQGGDHHCNEGNDFLWCMDQ